MGAVKFGELLRRALPPWRKDDAQAEAESGSFSIVGADGRPINFTGTAAEDRRTVGSGQHLSVLMAPVWWIARNAGGVRLAILDDNDVPVIGAESDAMTALLPHPLRFSLVQDLVLYGNAYAEIIRGSMGAPAELRYLSATWVETRPISGDKIEYIRVVRPRGVVGGPLGVVRRVHADDLLHVQWGIDPIEPATGVSALFALLQDAATDREAATIAAQVLRQRGLTGLFMSPRSAEGGAMLDEPTARKWEQKIDKDYSGNGRGKALVANIPMEVQHAEADLQRLAMKAIRDISEERVCAVLGVPASVVGFGAGLSQSRVGATMKEQRGIAWDNGVLPNLDLLLDACTMKLAPEFGSPGRFGYQLPPGHVAAMEAEVLARRANLLYTGGIAKRGEARTSVDLSADDSDDIYVSDAKAATKPPATPTG